MGLDRLYVLLIAFLVVIISACATEPATDAEADVTAEPGTDADVSDDQTPDSTADDSTADAEPTERTPVTVGGIGSLSDAGIYVAFEQGYFEEQGFDVTLETFTSALDIYPSLAAGQIQVTRSAQGSQLFNAIAGDIPIRIVADGGNTCPGYGYLGITVRADLVESGEVSEPADLTGRSIAVAGQGGISDIFLERVLEEGGLTFDDVDHLELGFPEQLAAFGNEALDAAVMIEPTMTAGIEQGLTELVWPGDEIYPCAQTAMLVYSPEFAEDADAGNRFAIAYLQGVRDYNEAFSRETGGPDSPMFDEVVDILTTHTRVTDPEAYASIVPVGLHPDGDVNVDALKDDMSFYVDAGLVEEPPDLDEAVDMSFIEHAVEVLGPFQAD